jgi:hypothetical protein
MGDGDEIDLEQPALAVIVRFLYWALCDTMSP